MPAAWSPAPSFDEVGLLERAIGYTRGCLAEVTPQRLSCPTPCRAWDLRALLRHMDDSLVALQEAADLGSVAVAPPEGVPCGGSAAFALVDTIRTRACTLLGAWIRTRGGAVLIADRPIPAALLAGTGALEIAIHGWDVAESCGAGRPLPAALARELMALAPLLVTGGDRPARFAAAVDVGPHASAGARLLGLVGRRG